MWEITRWLAPLFSDSYAMENANDRALEILTTARRSTPTIHSFRFLSSVTTARLTTEGFPPFFSMGAVGVAKLVDAPNRAARRAALAVARNAGMVRPSIETTLEASSARTTLLMVRFRT